MQIDICCKRRNPDTREGRSDWLTLALAAIPIVAILVLAIFVL